MDTKSPLAAANGPPPANLLLAALPAEVFSRIAPALDVVPLKLKEILHPVGEPIRHVYFPAGGFCSIVTVLADGTMVEVATIGREGALGVSAHGDGGVARAATMVQGAADICYRMTGDRFRDEMRRHDAFYNLVTRFADALVGFVMQSTACNAIHSVEQRLARWLLLAHDRMGRDDFPLTQEFAAMMLGASRPTVTVVAGTLQKAGLITYHRGHVTIVDREHLEEASCECYRAVDALLKDVFRAAPQA